MDLGRFIADKKQISWYFYPCLVFRALLICEYVANFKIIKCHIFTDFFLITHFISYTTLKTVSN